MYLNDDTLLRVRLATRRAREMESLIRSQIARSRALNERAAALRGSGSGEELRPLIEKVLQASMLLNEQAREHLHRSRGLLARSRGAG